jgi:hypothetical protein
VSSRPGITRNVRTSEPFRHGSALSFSTGLWVHLARYQARDVHAAEVIAVDFMGEDGPRLTIRDAAGQRFDIACPAGLLARFTPEPGDYYVVCGRLGGVVPKQVFEKWFAASTAP